jgi:EAL domain-containing protein (putative c-di-GMP-specific phosphodiesterase class I)
MKLRVVAEGVETTEQHEYLKTVGCDEMQGYFASKPLPGPEVLRFLVRHLGTGSRPALVAVS